MQIKTPIMIAGMLISALVIMGQAVISPEMTAAAALIKQQKFAEAATAYERVVTADPKNAVAWAQLGMARYSLKDYAHAAEAIEKNIALTNDPFSIFNLACIYALMGQQEKAILQLTKAVEHPKVIPAAINFDDPDLISIKTDARFAALKEKVDRKVRPCMYSIEARQFDFFVGEWDAYDPAGRKTGSSVIQSFAGGCGILENWTNAFGSGGGKSINFYDPVSKKWYQHWIGSDGVPVNYSGTFIDEALRFEKETLGKTALGRLTFFNVDRDTVRQLSEASTDGGKSWTVVYDFKYVRRK